MTNEEVAGRFEQIAQLLQIEDANVFRVRSYERAAESIRGLGRELAEVRKGEGGLQAIPGIGEAIALKIEELLDTGELDYLNELLAKYPPGFLELLKVPGLGPKRAALFYHELGISSVDDLEEACVRGEVRKLKGMGEKSEQKLLQAIGSYWQGRERALLGEMLPQAESMVQFLRDLPEVIRADYAGSVRRARETVGDIDVLATSEDPAAVCSAFAESGILDQVELAGDEAESERVAGETEESVYEALGLPWIAPELREDRGEIQAAEAGELPELIEADDIRCDLHLHTTWSDGRASIAELGEACRERGYSHMGITDHSATLYVAGGIGADEIARQREEIDELNAGYADEGAGFRALLGTEADILPDGGVDATDEVLALVDFVIGAIHQGMSPDADRMTGRVIAALETGVIDIVAHPTGRLLLERAAHGMHVSELVDAAAELDVALEINAAPDRLDLSDAHARLAQERGVKLAINTDAHAPQHLDFMRYGVLTARRGWISAETVINTWPLERLEEWLAGRR